MPPGKLHSDSDGNFGGKLMISLKAKTMNNLVKDEKGIRRQLDTQLLLQLWAQLYGQSYYKINIFLWRVISDNLPDQIEQQIHNQLWWQIDDQLKGQNYE